MAYQGELKDTFGVDFYKPIFIENLKRIVASKFQLVKLSAISDKITKGETPLWKGDKYQEKGILFVKSENVLTGSLSLSKSVFINDEVHQRMRRSQLEKGDVLLNIVGASIGRSCVYDRLEAANINQAVCLIRPSKDVNPHWLCTVLNSEPFQTVLDQIKSGGARDNIDLYQVRALKVPLPPPDIQSYIAEIMESVHTQKRQKEQEAEAVLDSINGYVLAELGIQVPAVEEKKYFVVYAARIEGRMDPEYNHPKFEFYKEPKSHFVLKKIKELSVDIRTGLPIRQDFRPKDGKYPYYGANGIIGYMDDYTHDGRYLVVGQDGYIGNHYVVEGKFWASNHNWVAMFRENVNLEYVKAFLDAWNYEYLITGGVIPKLTKEAFESISIPIPPFDIQERIADEAVKRQSKAAKLRQEADAIAEEAQREVERILLEGVSG